MGVGNVRLAVRVARTIKLMFLVVGTGGRLTAVATDSGVTFLLELRDDLLELLL